MNTPYLSDSGCFKLTLPKRKHPRRTGNAGKPAIVKFHGSRPRDNKKHEVHRTPCVPRPAGQNRNPKGNVRIEVGSGLATRRRSRPA